jgi:hypothetical protein
MCKAELDGADAPEGSGGRQEVRLPADLSVRLVWVDMSQACAGWLRDVSASGARVSVSGKAGETRDVYLLAHLPGEREPRRIGAVLRWQVGDIVGLRFEPPVPPELVYAMAGLDGPPGNQAAVN